MTTATMKKSTVRTPRVVVITRPTPYQQLIARHGTRQQASFFLEARGQSMDEVEAQHRRTTSAVEHVAQAIPSRWRRSRLSRSDLDRFLFEPDDLVVAVGQDGLVANLAKYLSGQPVIGLNPDPDLYPGILVPHAPEAARDLLHAAAEGGGRFERRTMVEAELDDGQVLKALNEVFVGHRTHQSARYRIRCEKAGERHSSSGVIVSTGTGATGWASSIHKQSGSDLALPTPTEPRLAFFVREAWPGANVGASLVEGLLDEGEALELISEMDEDGVVFGDGIEADRLPFSWGRCLTVRRSEDALQLMLG